MHPRNRTYLRLEVLEDLTTPASVPAPVVATLSQANLLLSDVEAQAGLIRRLDQSFSRPSTDGVGVVTLAELQAVSSASLPASFQVALLPGLLLLSSTGQAQPGTSSVPSPTDADATGFTGRLVFPGTGVQALVANGSGPLTQSPGLYLVGGSNPQPNDTAMIAQPAQATGQEEAGGALDDLVPNRFDGAAPDEVWLAIEWPHERGDLPGRAS